MHKGETLKLEITVANATAVEFRFGGAQVRTVTTTKNGDTFTASAPTTEWHAGVYAWQAWATLTDGTSVVVDTGNLDLIDVLGVGDARPNARKIVEMIDAQMAGNASEAVRRYRINNRELERYSVSELITLRTYWLAQMKRENGRSGLGRRIAVEF